MEVRPDLQLSTMLKSMRDVIIPAIDPENQLAQEQAALIVGMIELMRKRLPLSYRYDRDELARYVNLGESLTSRIDDRTVGSTSGQLTKLTAVALDVLRRARAEPRELEESVLDMRECIGAVLQRIMSNASSSVRRDITRIVLQFSGDELRCERSWLVDLGFEIDSRNTPPPIDEFLSPVL